MWQTTLLNTRREIPGLGASERYFGGPNDIRAAKVAAMVMKAFPEAPAPREEDAEHLTGVRSRHYRGTGCLGFTLVLLTATFGDCLIRAHYKHQVTFARS